MNIKHTSVCGLILFTATLVLGGIPFGMNPMGAGGQLACGSLRNLRINGTHPTIAYNVFDLKLPPTLTVEAGDCEEPPVTQFTWDGVSWELPLSTNEGLYSVVMPVIPRGPVTYKVVASETGDTLPATGTYTYVNSETLGIDRQPNLVTWKAVVGANLNYAGVLDASWEAYKIAMPDNTVSLAGITNLPALSHYEYPRLRTRAKLKAGSIWFKAKFTGDEGVGPLYVESSTKASPFQSHVVVKSLEVPYTSNWIQYRIDINSDTEAYYQLRHPWGFDSHTISIKDIVVSAPAADVVIVKDDVDYSPGYPSRDDPVSFKISVTNVVAGTPASNISPKLIWRLNEGAWTQTPMPLISGNQYGVTLPKMEPGQVEYYYRADFTGYAYTGLFYPTGGNPADNESDFAKLLDADGYLHECKSPATLPDFPDSHLYNLSAEPYPTPRYGGSAYTNGFSYYEFTITE